MRSALVVDDEPDIAAALAEVLEEESFRVTLAYNGKAALELLRKEVFDLVITDLMMPLLDGHELLRWIRAQDRLATLAVIVMSAGPIDTQAQSLASAYLCKPFELAELLSVVAALTQS